MVLEIFKNDFLFLKTEKFLNHTVKQTLINFE